MNLGNRIGGEWRAGITTRQNINPSDTAEVVGEFAQGTATDVEDAVAAAREAFVPWSRTGPIERHGILMRAAAEVGARTEELGHPPGARGGQDSRRRTWRSRPGGTDTDLFRGRGRRARPAPRSARE